MSSERRAELAAFLRAHRARLRPKDIGLVGDLDPGRRRTPGLRREEVAELAGVSLTWYTWLEQGRKIAASPQVIDALARALRLDADAHRHLRRLADLPEPKQPGARPDTTARWQRLVDSMMPNPASIYDGCFDYVVWNHAYVTTRIDPAELEPGRCNLIWMMFTHERNRSAMRNWERAARALLGQFRTTMGRRPDDQRLAALVTALSEVSPEFRAWWSEYSVREFRPATIGVGADDLDLYQLRPIDAPDLLMVVQLPAAR